MLKLYANENFPLETVEILRKLGYDILTTGDVGKAGMGIPDDEVLQFSIENKRAVLTINRRDFKKLHNRTSKHFGIIICTKNDDFADFADCIHQVLQQANFQFENTLVKVYRNG